MDHIPLNVEREQQLKLILDGKKKLHCPFKSSLRYILPKCMPRA